MMLDVISDVPKTTTKLLLGRVVWIICLALPLLALVQVGIQLVTPPLPPRLTMVRDIPLPSPFPDPRRTSQDPFAPGVALLFDHFDFQALDQQRHLLFIAHTGPSPDREQQVNPHFDPNTDAKNDGNVIVFDTRQQKVVGLLDIPQVAGVVLAPDLHKVYAADSNDSIIYVIDETTFKTTQIPLQDNDSPDDLWYDQADHLVLVSDPGTPANPDKTNVIDRKNQNVTFINALTDKVVGRVMVGRDGKWGDDVGHVRFDPQLHQIFVVTQQLADPDSLDPNLLPPPGTAWLVAIDPLTYKIIRRLNLPSSCITPHGLAIDTISHIAFIACIDSTPSILLRVDLQKMEVIHEPAWTVESHPDMLVFDHPLHLLYVAAGTGISIFREDGRDFQWLANYTFGVNTHSLAVDEETHDVYIPIPRMGGRPVLRIMHYTDTMEGR
jgi:hypothetical protein